MQQAMLRQSNSASAAVLPNEVIAEILSFLPVKPLIRLRCFNKFFKTLISDPYFVQMHLNNSSRNLQLALKHSAGDWNSSLVTVSIPGLLQNQFTFHHYLEDSRRRPRVVGSCNGLILITISYCFRNDSFYFWNPAMRTKSRTFIFFSDFKFYNFDKYFKFSFGYDNLTQTYKVIAFYVEEKRGSNPNSVVKVFSLGDNSWRNIQCFPVLPLHYANLNKNNGVHLKGTINWMTLCDYINNSFTVDQFVILSLDLSTETYTQLLLPRRFDKVPCCPPNIVVLMDCLCFCHDFERTHFVIWQMKDFGVQDSWIQLFKISHEHFYKCLDLLPLYLSENGDTLILANNEDREAFIYNYKDNSVEKIGITYDILWSQAKDYVESLVSTH